MAQSILKPSLRYGILAGVFLSIVMAISMVVYFNHPDLEPSAVIGYTSMLVAFSMMFIGIRNYREKENGGVISFLKALQIGALIALVGSTFYVVTWLIIYYGFIPDFFDRYIELCLHQAQVAGASPAEIAAQTKEMAEFREMYQNPFFVVLFTYMEVLPLGLIVSLLSAVILRRKVARTA